METLMAIVIGVLFAAGIYMILRRHPVQVIIGLTLLFNATNLLVFTAAGLNAVAPPLIAEGAQQPPPGIADPLPQALVLTAIVISFGIIAFALVLFSRSCESLGVDDISKLENTE